MEKIFLHRKSWEEFKESGCFWLINNLLNVFGWQIVIQKKNQKIIDVYPARTCLRGNSEKTNASGYKKITKYLKENIDDLVYEIKNHEEEE